MLSAHSLSEIFRAGFPIYTQLLFMPLYTTLPAATLLFDPILLSGSTDTLEPKKLLSFIVTLPVTSQCEEKVLNDEITTS